MKILTHVPMTLVLSIFLVGCASTPLPEGSIADQTLKKGVVKHLTKMEYYFYSCSTLRTLRVLNIQVTSPPDGGKWKEQWHILSCNGENHLYDVEFTPDPKGGLFIGTKHPEVKN